MGLSRPSGWLRLIALLQLACALHNSFSLPQGKQASVTLLNDYIVLGSLGKGAYGSVKLCYSMLDDSLYALKVGTGVGSSVEAQGRLCCDETKVVCDAACIAYLATSPASSHLGRESFSCKHQYYVSAAPVLHCNAGAAAGAAQAADAGSAAAAGRRAGRYAGHVQVRAGKLDNLIVQALNDLSWDAARSGWEASGGRGHSCDAPARQNTTRLLLALVALPAGGRWM